MSQESEEKKLPASEKKLREARRKGQVSNSRDLVSGFSIFAALAFLYIAWPGISGRIRQFADLATAAQSRPFAQAGPDLIHQALVTLILIVAPLAAVVIAAILVFGVVATRGPVFSVEPLKPQFEHVNPAKGLKRIASLRNVVEFCKSLAKMVLLAAVFVAIMMAWLEPLFEVPGCGGGCVAPTLVAILTPLGIAAALAFIVVGLFDVPIQRWLYLRDLRMTRTEYKREHKDIEGDPLIRQALQRQRREAASRPAKLGIVNAVLVLAAGDRLVGLRYVRGETPVPVAVAKAQGGAAEALLLQARERGLPIVHDAPLTETLFAQTAVGGYVDADLFPAIVGHLVRQGLV
jgi:type III secretion protein U